MWPAEGPALWYLGLQTGSAVVCMATAYAAHAWFEGRHRLPFVVSVALLSVWTALRALGVVLDDPTVLLALRMVSDLVVLVAISGIGYFATMYTARSTSLRKPVNAAFAVWFVATGATTLLQPLLGPWYATTTYRTAPFTYLALEPGPVYQASLVGGYIVLGVTVYYLATLFIRSQHRPSRSMALLGVATAVAILPNVASNFLGLSPVPGYDLTPFGTVAYVVVLAYVVFGRGELDLAPMARDEIVDSLDDAVLGLDDRGRLIDYNDSARSLFPDGTTAPVGDPLDAVVPELAETISLSTESAGEERTTYTTTRSGTWTHYSVLVSPIVERDTVAGYSVILRDITATESAMRELRRQNDQLEAFATTVSHDLRNPLQVADGQRDLLVSQLEAGGVDMAAAGAGDLLDTTEDALARMDTVTARLRTLAEHAQSVDGTEPVDFREAVEMGWKGADTDKLTYTVTGAGHIEAERDRLGTAFEVLFGRSADIDATHVTVELTDDGFVYTDDGDAATAGNFGGPAKQFSDLDLQLVRTEAEAMGWTVALDTDDGTRLVVMDAAIQPRQEARGSP